MIVELSFNHRVRVQAANSIGSGSFSSAVKVTTKPLPPAPPSLECVSSTYNTIRLKWQELENCDRYTVRKVSPTGQTQIVSLSVSHWLS